jgi:hypothetical protein
MNEKKFRKPSIDTPKGNDKHIQEILKKLQTNTLKIKSIEFIN